MSVLFLDFDGVLHPSEVYMIKGEPILQLYDDQDPELLYLFCWAPLLEQILDDHDPAGRIKIVLSTSWAHHFGWEEAASKLPESLRSRVIGSTEKSQLPRGEQILNHANDHGIDSWIAVDDDDWGWPYTYRNHLIRCDREAGISEAETQWALRDKLEGMLGHG